MSNTVIIHGPMACGKTRHAQLFRSHYRCVRIQDSVVNGRAYDGEAGRVQHGSLILTYESPKQISKWAPDGARVVSFELAMREIGG